MLEWLRNTFFARRSLDGLAGPTRVRLRGRLVGEEHVVSPMTGRRGLVIEYRFWDHRVIERITSHRRPTSIVIPLAVGRLGDAVAIQVESHDILVPIVEDTRLTFAGTWDPAPVPHLLPDVYPRAHPELVRAREELRYDEKVLHADETVELSGFVEAIVHAAPRGAYRAGPSTPWRFEARPALGRLTLRELAT